jgi:hypothetical protein
MQRVKKKYHFEFSYMFAPSQDFDAELEMNSAWEKIIISQFQPKRVYVEECRLLGCYTTWLM